ncbi:pilus assembly protein TadG [Trinickia symbiotica]|uniref:Pilus assembly protein TadG n=1 Tax=Trinickia symbiotica TaxID=863227 RepID=A0A2T3XUN8_9BURK|nr:TadE/TadG family type IV pilus assembly protein [Trinickia symbiotica]PTB20240.1 pilus assembly protein TadG [Trinickia symbiotica]
MNSRQFQHSRHARLRRRDRARGAAMVEFAIFLVPLIMLAMGVAEFGRAIWQYEALTKSTRDAARYLSTYLPNDPAYPVASAKCLVVYGSTSCPSGQATPLVSGLTTSMVVICDAVNSAGCQDSTDPAQFSNVPTYDTTNGASGGTQSGSINLVEVKVEGFPYTQIEPFFKLPTPFNFNNILTVMRQVS